MKTDYSGDTALYRIICELDKLSERGVKGSRGLDCAFGEAGKGEAAGTENAPGDVKGGTGPEFSVSAVRQHCTVKTDWIERIENAMPYVEKAVEQSRSLLRKEGDVVRIDKAKHFSKESITHLAKNSSAIKRVEEGKVFPEEIYVTENEDEFAIYENRFLYMVLGQLRSFVSLRLSEIKKAAEGNGICIKVSCSGSKSGESASYYLEMKESSRSGSFASSADFRETVARIEEILDRTDGLLAVQLMRDLATAPKLIPPVIRTNIIKNNTDFAAVFELHSYMNVVGDAGFEVEREETGLEKLDRHTRNVIRMTALIQLFAGYQGAFENWEYWRKELEREDAELQLTKLLQKNALIERKRAELYASHLDETAYTKLLEEKLAENTMELEKTLNEKVELIGRQIIQEEEQKRIEAENGRLRQEIIDVRATSMRQIRETVEKKEQEYREEIDLEREKNLAALEAAKKEWDEERSLLKGRLRARGIADNDAGSPEDISDRAGFIELEKEKEAFDRYFKEQWKRNKRIIRKNVRKAEEKAGEDVK